MLKLIGIFSVVGFSELMQRIFKYGNTDNTSLLLIRSKPFDTWNAFICHYMQKLYILTMVPLCQSISAMIIFIHQNGRNTQKKENNTVTAK